MAAAHSIVLGYTSGSGNVTGPGSASNGHVAVFNGTSGQLVADGGAVGNPFDQNLNTTDGVIFQSVNTPTVVAQGVSADLFTATGSGGVLVDASSGAVSAATYDVADHNGIQWLGGATLQGDGFVLTLNGGWTVDGDGVLASTGGNLDLGAFGALVSNSQVGVTGFVTADDLSTKKMSFSGGVYVGLVDLSMQTPQQTDVVVQPGLPMFLPVGFPHVPE